MARMMVFDLDGTLVDSVPDLAAAVNRMLGARDLAPLGRAEVAAMVGDGAGVLVERALAARGAVADDAAKAAFLADYTAYATEQTRLFPGAEAAMDALAAAGWRLAVCTNKPEAATDAILRALGVADRFASVGGGDSFPVRKPDPEHLRLTIARGGGEASRALMLGDHANDVAAAGGLGIPCVFAGWGYGRPGMEHGAIAVAPDFAALPVLAERLLPEG